MTQETKKRIHLVYGIAVGAISILAGICLIAACLNIYYSGVASDAGQIYTRQVVAESFTKIAIPVYSCLVLVIGGMIFNWLNEKLDTIYCSWLTHMFANFAINTIGFILLK